LSYGRTRVGEYSEIRGLVQAFVHARFRPSPVRGTAPRRSAAPRGRPRRRCCFHRGRRSRTRPRRSTGQPGRLRRHSRCR